MGLSKNSGSIYGRFSQSNIVVQELQKLVIGRVQSPQVDYVACVVLEAQSQLSNAVFVIKSHLSLVLTFVAVHLCLVCNHFCSKFGLCILINHSAKVNRRVLKHSDIHGGEHVEAIGEQNQQKHNSSFEQPIETILREELVSWSQEAHIHVSFDVVWCYVGFAVWA